MANKRIGLIVNPIAGMGGSVGLKGTDGDLAATAIKLGALPIAGSRTVTALSQLADIKDQLTVLTCSDEMGEEAARSAGIDATIVATVANAATASADTVSATEQILQHDPELLLFVGGDGTARDVFGVVGDRLPVLGVPAGVKMHSAVFAATARAAGEVARRFLVHPHRNSLLHAAEIVDRDGGDKSLHIYGMARVPRLSFLVPGAKAVERISEQAGLAGAIRRVAEIVADARISLIGPGSTMQALKQQLGFSGTVLGVDAVTGGHCIASDLSEQRILELIEGQDTRIVVTVVGGQGYLFGRGNQQLSPRVIRATGSGNILVVASLQKLTAIPGQQLLVDTGDEDLDRELAGYRQVIVGNSKTVMMPVKIASLED
jgi:predicted polyphosphate/ATP-dependent NAD kinase